MRFKKTKIAGLELIMPEPNEDARGSFVRLFCKEEFGRQGIAFDVVQINRSFTKRRGTVRGLHFQREPNEEGKIVQCLRGAIYDVVADIRRGSPTYGEWVARELSAENGTMLFVSKGLVHGFQTLTDDCEVLYFMSESYSPEHASGVRWNDPLLGIPWPVANPLFSERDAQWPLLRP